MANYTRDLKVKRNSSLFQLEITGKGNKKVIPQAKDLKWKKKRKYGYRWIVEETAFSSIKRG